MHAHTDLDRFPLRWRIVMTSTERTAATGRDRHPVREGFAAGTNFAAATLLLVVSVLGVFQGISALANDEIFVAGIDYVYKFDLTTWGWIVLVLGLIGVVIGCGMYTGATWARVGAVVIAGVSIIINFLWLPYYPVWSIVLIALDVVIIWAVTTWNPERLDRL